MSVILGALMGIFLGVTLFALVSATRIEELEHKAYSYKRKYQDERFKVIQRDSLIKDYQEEIGILLMNAKEQRTKQKDLENNIELLSYNIPELKKELVEDSESNN